MDAFVQAVLWLVGVAGGAGVVLVGVSGLFGKWWADRTLKDHGAKIDKALAKANSAMRMVEQRNQIAFTTLHTKRAELIYDVYKRLGSIEKAARNMQADITYRLSPQKIYAEQEGEDSSNPVASAEQTPNVRLVIIITDLVSELGTVVDQNRILFSASTAELLDKFLDEASHIGYWYLEQGGEPSEPGKHDDLVRALAWRRSHDAILPIRKQLEDEFRTLLGVEQQTEAEAA